MPEYSPRLNIEKALGTENVNRAYFMRVIDQIDKKAATVGADGKIYGEQLPLNDTVNSVKTDEAATANAVRKAYDNANSKYAKPATGIPKADLTAAVQTSLNKADSAVQDVSTLATKEETSQQFTSVNINIVDLAIELETMKAAELTGVDANIFIETFQNLDDVTLERGGYDSANKRLEV